MRKRAFFLFLALCALGAYIAGIDIIAYIAGIFFVVKAKLISFFIASKNKLLLFIKTLTLYKVLNIAIKRFIIDNYLSKWLEKNIIAPIKRPLKSFIRYYMALHIYEKIKKSLVILLPTSLLFYIAYSFNLIEHILFYAEIKTLIIAFFKFLWLFIGKIGSLLYNILFTSWIAPLLQIFALSFLIEQLEKLPLLGKPLAKLIKKIDAFFALFFDRIFFYWHRFIERFISLRVRKAMYTLAKKLEFFLEKIKYKNELFLMKRFIKSKNYENYFNKHLQNYLEREALATLFMVEQKRDFLQFLNKATKDNIDIVAFFDIAPYPPIRDVFIIESFASKYSEGNRATKIASDSFWCLSLYEKPLLLAIGADEYLLKPKKIRLIHTKKQDFTKIKLLYQTKTLDAIKL